MIDLDTFVSKNVISESVNTTSILIVLWSYKFFSFVFGCVLQTEHVVIIPLPNKRSFLLSLIAPAFLFWMCLSVAVGTG